MYGTNNWIYFYLNISDLNINHQTKSEVLTTGKLKLWEDCSQAYQCCYLIYNQIRKCTCQYIWYTLSRCLSNNSKCRKLITNIVYTKCPVKCLLCLFRIKLGWITVQWFIKCMFRYWQCIWRYFNINCFRYLYT